jgi:hypothetical protein
MPPEQEIAVVSREQTIPKKVSLFEENGLDEDTLLIGWLSGQLERHEVFPDLDKSRPVPNDSSIKSHLKTRYGMSSFTVDELIWTYRRKRWEVRMALDRMRSRRERSSAK